ncbi:hypothetical protein BJ165DRAFT_1344200 [Panaeolus papilionaceus]|nr:hypothetical protein BJ165DRAFT_1344200 [Panaeolus papilionaceus]
MFTKVFSILALGAVAVSASGYSTANVNGIDYSCNTSAVQCCGALQAPRNYNAADIAALVGVAVQDVCRKFRTACNPVTVIGAGTGANCASSPTCCEQNFQNQFLGINCTPATVGL